MDSLKVLSWNILHGGGSRSEQIVEVIEASSADIVALQEFRHGRNGSAILGGLASVGLTEVFAPETENSRQNTVILASRYPLKCEAFPSAGEQPVRGIKAEIRITARLKLNIVALHMPQKRAQVPLFTSLLELPAAWTTGYSLIIGDLNCGIPFEDSQTRSFYATHLFQQLLAGGWNDSWRRRYPDAREFSWVSARKGNGFRYDHALTSNLLEGIVESVAYDHSVRKRGVSDHSSLLLTLKAG